MLYKYPNYAKLDSTNGTARILHAPHVSVIDYMADTTGIYNPNSIHQIKDNYRTGRLRVNAASIENGIGKSVADIAKYVNRWNLGSSTNRMGVGYFYNIGNASQPVSGLIVNERFYVSNLTTQQLLVHSGVIESCTTYLSTGNLLLYVPCSILNGQVYMSPSGDVTWTTGIINVDSTVSLSNLTFDAGSSVSGTIDTFDFGGINEGTTINYDPVSGHIHEGSTWKSVASRFDIIAPVCDEGTYQYMFTMMSKVGIILRFDTLASNPKNDLTPFIAMPFASYNMIPNLYTRIDVNGNNWAIFGDGGFVYSSGSARLSVSYSFSRGVVIDSDIIYYTPDVIAVDETDTGAAIIRHESKVGRIKSLKRGVILRDNLINSKSIEVTRFGNTVYFIDYQDDKIYTYFNGNVSESTHTRLGFIRATTIWKGQLIILYHTGAIYRFYGNIRTLIGSLPSPLIASSIRGTGAALYVAYHELNSTVIKVDAFGYNKGFTKLNSTPILEITSTGSDSF